MPHEEAVDNFVASSMTLLYHNTQVCTTKHKERTHATSDIRTLLSSGSQLQSGASMGFPFCPHVQQTTTTGRAGTLS